MARVIDPRTSPRSWSNHTAVQRHRLTGADGPRAFLDAFHFACFPQSEVLASATPVSPCATYPNEDSWMDEPFVGGVVLLGDAAGWNDPIIGQGLAITLRDNAADLTTGALTIEPRPGPRPRITAGPRVGITRAVDLPLRFWIADSPSVSKR